MGGRPAARRGFRGPCAAGRPSGGPKGRAGCVAAHCVGPATRLRRALPSRPLGSSGLPGLVQRLPREPLNKSRSPSAPLFVGGDGVAAVGGRAAARWGFRSLHAAGRPSGGPKGRAGCVAAHCVGPATRLRRALPSRPLGSSGLPGLVQRFPRRPCKAPHRSELFPKKTLHRVFGLCKIPHPFCAAIAQQVEQLTCNEKVQGSIPCGGTSVLWRRGASCSGCPLDWAAHCGVWWLGGEFGGGLGRLNQFGGALAVAPALQSGGVPEWPKGSDCKSDGYAFEGSNPSPTTRALARSAAPRRALASCLGV